MNRKIRLEVCVDSPGGLAAAIAGGADRIELCAALALSGLTPTPGLMRLAATQPQPSYAMIRPRPGDFVYSPAEVDTMLGDIDAVRAAGLPGVVLGASLPSGELDDRLLKRLLEHATGLRATLHRAIDLAPDMAAALETAVGLGFDRVLTSGGAPRALEGAARIAHLVTIAGDRIAVMAGSGVTLATLAPLLQATGVGEVHASCSGPAPPLSTQAANLGFAGPAPRETRRELVAEMAAALSRRS